MQKKKKSAQCREQLIAFVSSSIWINPIRSQQPPNKLELKYLAIKLTNPSTVVPKVAILLNFVKMKFKEFKRILSQRWEGSLM